MRLTPDEQWARERVGQLPARWAKRLLKAWQGQREGAHDWREAEHAKARANAQLLKLTASLEAVRLPLDASDRDICERAQELAERCLELAQIHHYPEALRDAMARLVAGHGIAPPPVKMCKDIGPAIARMTDPLWLRRGLRRMHAQAVEAAAIELGYVNRAKDIYCSAETLRRRLQQNQRNAASLEATTATNEAGQTFTLAELAAKGAANKAIRRAELMTRIAGFERIAIDCGHAGLFMTITCPSRMHKWRTVGPDHARLVKPNPRYDGTNPAQAQRYLQTVWARIRARLAREGVRVYGFRIAEPNHDGCPHWHFLLFLEAGQLAQLRAAVLHHALADSPDEPGAHRRRVDFKAMDAAKGTAAGYVAKYVSKNIDGYKVGQDLFGNPALDTAARVEAWATTWRIRQFQQVGGAPVTVWRELRRVEAIPEGAPAHLAKAHRAVNKLAVIEGHDNASVAWDHYTAAQGGVFCGRDYAIRIATREVQGVGRYGEPLGQKPFGVSTTSREHYTPPHMAHMGGVALRVVEWIAESKRHQWSIGGKAAEQAQARRNAIWQGLALDLNARGLPGPAEDVAHGLQLAQQDEARANEGFSGLGFAHAAQPLAPWTCVNNCTEGTATDGSKNEIGQAGRDSAGVCQLQPVHSHPDWACGRPPYGPARCAGEGIGQRLPGAWLQ